MKEVRHTHKIVVAKPEGNTQFERSKLRLEDNIKIDLKTRA
jgi:hypothetical protein